MNNIETLKMSCLAKTITVLFVNMLVAANSIQAINDHKEIWTDVGGYTSWKEWDLSLTMGNYFLDHSGWYLINSELQVTIPSRQPVYFGFGYKQEHYKWHRQWYVEYRPMLQMFYKTLLGRVRLRNRSRMEFRFIGSTSALRFRNEIKASLKGNGRFSPYLSTELFMNDEPFRYSRNRSYLGVKCLIEKQTVDFYACWQVTKRSQVLWHHLFAIGTGIYIAI